MPERFITSAVLAGGRSKRFGEDKGLYKIKGTPLIEFVLAKLKTLSDEIIIVTNRPDAYSQFDAKIITDRPEFAGRGPLSGLYAALLSANSERILLTACDMPFICPNLIRFMWSIPETADVIVPIFNNRLQPLLAIYHKDTLPLIEKLILEDKHSLTELITRCNHYLIPEHLVRIHSSYPDPFVNINTKDDLLFLESLRSDYKGKLFD